MAQPLRVLSLNCGMMGHVTYQNNLDKGMKRYAPDIDFRTVMMLPYPAKDWVGYWGFKLIAKHVPGVRDDRDYRRFRSELGQSLRAERVLRQEIKTFVPDVIHLHTQALALTAIPLLARYPSVVGIDLTTALLIQEHHRPVTYAPIVKRERSCFHAASHVLSWTEFAAKSVIADYGVPAERVSVERPFLCDLTHEPRAERKGGDVRLLFVGNDFERKGGRELLAVWEREKWAERGACLDIVSGQLSGDEKLPAGVQLHRNLTAASGGLLALYRDADIFVMPTHEDASPMVYMEAMAAGLPSIGTAVMGVPELVKDGVNGLTVTPKDTQSLAVAMKKLIEDASLRKRLGEAGLARYHSEFDPRTNTRRVADIFLRVAGSSALAHS
ncbi:MAG: glycosyltransferase family 4 protein [Armatimonadetes bacterium]|nr:glycosyltransferase family 4 protein [Armatimonadota bacterium]